MYGITDLSAYVLGAVAIILLPGPNSMYCLTIAGQYGVRIAYRAVAAILLGDTLLILATVLGAGTVLKLYPALFHGIRMVGGLYLAWLGWQLLQAAARKWHFKQPVLVASESPAAALPKNVFGRALMLSLTNPKAILFYLSFFVQFVDPAYPHPGLSFLILSLILQALSLVYLNALVFSGHQLTQTFRRRTKTSAAAMALVGLMFFGFAVRMWAGA